MNSYLIVLAGIVCAGSGGELFVRGSVGLAQWDSLKRTCPPTNPVYSAPDPRGLAVPDDDC